MSLTISIFYYTKTGKSSYDFTFVKEKRKKKKPTTVMTTSI